MCGILAYLGAPPTKGALLPPVHRGPDGTGRRDFETPAGPLRLEHWRLSILDLSEAGAQPMSYGDGRCWVVLNGEIFNYLEIREELETRGYRFVSRSDTEVLLAAWTCWSEACLEKFNGMFAFALYDAHAHRLFAARDRFGVKPLYVVNAPEGFALASEIKQVAGLPFVSRRIEPQRAFDFLAYGMLDHTHATLFRDVRQLQGGECILLDLARWRPGRDLSVRRWHTLRPQLWKGGRREGIEAYGELLRDSVRLRLRADVTVGSCLSGGMDSSAIVCLMHDLLRGESKSAQMTFSSCFDDPRFDERPFIRCVAEKTGARSVEVFPSADDLFAHLEDLVWHQDEPFSSTSVFAQSCVFRAARAAGVKVMLDGQGGDEQLASYPMFAAPFVLDALARGRLPSAWRRVDHFRRAHSLEWVDFLKQAMSLYAPSWLDEATRKALGSSMIPPWLSASGWRTLGMRVTKPWTVEARTRPGEDRVQQLSRAMIVRNSLPMLLHWEDRNSMRFGVEARVPFMDYRVVEWALGFPAEFKIEGNQTKIPLRKAMAQIIPQPVLDRTDKMGFVTPEAVWMKETATAEVRRRLEDALGQFPDYFHAAVVRNRFEAMRAGKAPHSPMFWKVLCFGVWAKRFGMTF